MNLKQENKELREMVEYQTSVCKWISEKVELKGISGEIVKDFLGHIADETEKKLNEIDGRVTGELIKEGEISQ